MTINKKIGGLIVLSALVMALSTTAFADTTTSEAKPKIGRHIQDLTKIAAEKGITVEALKAQMEAERAMTPEERLAKQAADKGITVAELEAQMEAEREEKLAKRAAEKGITVAALEAQMEAEKAMTPEERLAKRAADKGITVEALKAQMEKEGPLGHGPGHGPGGKGFGPIAKPAK